MNLYIVFFKILIVLNLCTTRQIQASPVAGKISFTKKTIDIGTIPRGTKANAKFAFTNTGKGILKIKGIHASCGCIAVNFDTEREFPPNTSDELLIEFDSTNFTGDISKTISVIANGDKNHHSLTIKGRITEEFSIYPPLLNFGSIAAGQPQTLETIVRPLNIKNLNIELAAYNAELFDINIIKETVNWHIKVTLKQNVTTGFVNETIWLKSNSIHLPEIALPIRANITGNITHTPNYIDFGMIQPNEILKRTIQLRSQRPFKLNQIDNRLAINGKNITNFESLYTIDWDAAKKTSSQSEISFSLKNDGTKLGSVHGKLRILSDDPSQDEIVVDYYAFFADGLTSKRERRNVK